MAGSAIVASAWGVTVSSPAVVIAMTFAPRARTSWMFESTLGRTAEAEPYLRAAVEKNRRLMGETHPYTLTMTRHLGDLLRDQGKPAEAEVYLREALEKVQRLHGEDHPETLNLIGDQLGLSDGGGFWGAIGSLNDNFGLLGYVIVGIFIAAWLISYLVYRINGYDEIEVSAV